MLLRQKLRFAIHSSALVNFAARALPPMRANSEIVSIFFHSTSVPRCPALLFISVARTIGGLHNDIDATFWRPGIPVELYRDYGYVTLSPTIASRARRQRSILLGKENGQNAIGLCRVGRGTRLRAPRTAAWCAVRPDRPGWSGKDLIPEIEEAGEVNQRFRFCRAYLQFFPRREPVLIFEARRNRIAAS